jgi:hypothetical protein
MEERYQKREAKASVIQAEKPPLITDATFDSTFYRLI